jgi:hypothetical protein
MSHSTHTGFNAPSTSIESSIDFPISFLRRTAGVDGPPRSRWSDAVGVGHVRIVTTVSRFGKRLAVFAIASGVILAAIAELLRGVGHDPEPVALVRSAGMSCSQNSPAPHIPQRGQVSEDGSEIAAGNKSRDVLKQNGSRLYPANDLSGCWPHIAFVVGSSLLACDAERLAGETCANHVRNSSILVSGTGECELTHVSEDGRGWQVSIRDSGGKHALAVVIPFDVADAIPSEQVMGAEQSTACAAE